MQPTCPVTQQDLARQRITYLEGFHRGRKPCQLHAVEQMAVGYILLLGVTQAQAQIDAQLPQPGQRREAATLQKRAVT